jgi:PAT family beta-lactamase induction signal transducer AmpG
MFGRRRGWLFFSQFFLILSILGLGSSNPSEDLAFTAWMAFFVAFFSATQDIVIDAYRIEILHEDEQGAGAGMIIFGYRGGNLLAGFVALLIAASAGFMVAYWAMAVLVLGGTIAALVHGEPESKEIIVVLNKPPITKWERIQAWFNEAVIAPFRDFAKRNYWFLILFFVVIYKVGDALASTMTAPFIIELGFSLEEAAWANKMVGFWALLIGTYIGGSLIYWVGLFRALMIGGILMMVSNLSFAALALMGYNVPMLAFTIGFENFATGIGLSVFVAYLSGLCNIAYTATQYALLSSFMAIGRTWVSGTSGFMVEAWGWVNFFLFTTVAAIPGLIILYLLWQWGIRPEEEKELQK